MSGARAELPPPDPTLPADMINPPTIKLLNGGIPANTGIPGAAGQLPSGYYDPQGNWVVQQPSLPQSAPGQPAPQQTAPLPDPSTPYGAAVAADIAKRGPMTQEPAPRQQTAALPPTVDGVGPAAVDRGGGDGGTGAPRGGGGVPVPGGGYKPLYTYEQVSAAATKYRMDPELVSTTLHIESGYGANTNNKISPSNTGAFQMAPYGAPGGAGDTPENQLNLGIQKLAGEKADLERRLGRPAQNWEVYLAHQQGPSGAAALINNPSMPAGQVISNVTNGREGDLNISNNGGNPNAPASQFVQMWQDKYTRLSSGSSPLNAGPTDVTQDLHRAMDHQVAVAEEGLRLLQAEYAKADPGSAERQRLLTRMLDTQDQIEKAYLTKQQNPPTEKPVDMISNFGSLATVIGIVGGLFAHRPLVASLNAAGAAMEAINTNNHEQYLQAYKTWEKQTDMLAKGFEMEHTMYSEVLEDKRLSNAEKMEKTRLLAQIIGDRNALAAFEVGNYEKIWKLPLEREKLLQELQLNRDKMIETHYKTEAERLAQQTAQTDDQEWLTAHPEAGGVVPQAVSFEHLMQRRAQMAEAAKPASASTEGERRVEQAAAADDRKWLTEHPEARGVVPQDVQYQHYLDRKTQLSETTTAGLRLANDPKVAAWRQFMQENPGANAEQIQKFIDGMHGGPRSGIGAIMSQYKREHPEAGAEELIRLYANTLAESSAARSFGGGAMGISTRAFNTAINHIDLARQYATALNNGDVQWINAMKNRLKTEFGSPDVPNFEFVQQFIADEVTKGALGTAGGVTERTGLAARIRAASSPAQLTGIFDTAEHLMVGQLDSLRKAYTGWGIGSAEEFEEKFLTGRAREELARIGYPEAADKPPPPGGAAALPPGIPPGSVKTDKTFGGHPVWQAPDRSYYHE